ncbi:MAG: hypothetical protein C5B47_05790 [Verrucomicrobia bacterium]|nr:MAG: hypothetical protein C5B47_05790 [Verrucomicrobiota bacterium]
MQLSKKSEYALRALLYMAKRRPQLVHTIQEISQKEKIPMKFLEQIFPLLKQAGYVNSKRGLGGGHVLLRPSDQIRIFDIIVLMENTLFLQDRSTAADGGESDIAINIFLRELSTEIAQLLSTRTIADLLDSAQALEGVSFEI